jgi:putative addiction module component (TIGR02574 family)
MAPTLQSLGLAGLSRDNRISLVMELWDSIAAEATPSLLTEAQRAELLRRIEDDDANPDDVIPWEQVKAEARARIQKPC